MRRSLPALASAAGLLTLLTLLTAFVTWPRALQVGTGLDGHHDSLFSVWRIGWIAHALATAPTHLLDGNIFHPATRTLTYSDAMLLQGAFGAPLLWAGVPAILVYNLLLALGFVGSGVGMFVLVRYLTGAAGPALVAAAAFTMAPYRIEHLMHLELQWAMWVPLTFWALHRTVEERSARFGALAGVFLWLQIVSCVYYGVFLSLLLVVFVPLLLFLSGRRGARPMPSAAVAPSPLPPLALAAAIAVVLTIPYAWPYMQTARELGGRDMRDIVQYSARPINYLAATGLSRLWGWTADRWGAAELRLFPGLVVLVLSCASVVHRSRRWVLLYAGAATVAVELSFGLNSVVYRWLFEHVPTLQGLRSTARFAILVSAATAVLAGFGTQALIERRRGWQSAVVPVLLGLMMIDMANKPMPGTDAPVTADAPLYKVIRAGGPGVVIEFPLPNLNRLPGKDAYYALWSMQHWHPLVNGYSGLYPPEYIRTMVRMESFPNEAAMARLRTLNVRYLVVHQVFLEPDQYTALLLRIAGRPELRPWGVYKDPLGNAALFVMEP